MTRYQQIIEEEKNFKAAVKKAESVAFEAAEMIHKLREANKRDLKVSKLIAESRQKEYEQIKELNKRSI